MDDNLEVRKFIKFAQTFHHIDKLKLQFILTCSAKEGPTKRSNVGYTHADSNLQGKGRDRKVGHSKDEVRSTAAISMLLLIITLRCVGVCSLGK